MSFPFGDPLAPGGPGAAPVAPGGPGAGPDVQTGLPAGAVVVPIRPDTAAMDDPGPGSIPCSLDEFLS